VIGFKTQLWARNRLADAIFRNDEVVGSIPTSSTNLLNRLPTFSAVSIT
jgi:hypothetical protein